MVTTCNTSYDSALTYLAASWGISNNAVFDKLVLQASQRMLGMPVGQGATIVATYPVAAPATTAFQAGTNGTRVGVGND